MTTIPTTVLSHMHQDATRLYQLDEHLPRFVTIVEKDGRVAYSFHD